VKLTCICLVALRQDWLRNDVDIRQLLIETHSISNVPDPSDFSTDVESAGFAMFSKEVSSLPVSGGRCVEWSFIKLRRQKVVLRPGRGGRVANGVKLRHGTALDKRRFHANIRPQLSAKVNGTSLPGCSSVR
jgi:Methyltransferase domain